jgi:hypothetical protein
VMRRCASPRPEGLGRTSGKRKLENNLTVFDLAVWLEAQLPGKTAPGILVQERTRVPAWSTDPWLGRVQ